MTCRSPQANAFVQSKKSRLGRIFSRIVRQVLPVLLLASLPISEATPELFSSIDKIHGLFRISEELHRTFKNEYGAEAVTLTVTEGQLCAKRKQASVISRKLYEDSWTAAHSPGGAIESVFNGVCFMKFAGECVEYARCSDREGIFHPEEVPREGIHWAFNQTKVESWQREQAALVEKLLVSTDEAAELTLDLRADIAGAAVKADLGVTGLRKILKLRYLAFSGSVNPDTAPTPAGGADALPASLQELADSVEELAEAIPLLGDPNCGDGWLLVQDKVLNSLGSQTAAISAVNASELMQLARFDYMHRAVEALASGAALALQAGALAAIAELNCQSKFSPRSVSVQDLGPLQDAVSSLLSQLSQALPPPANYEAHDAPLRRCLAERLSDALDRVPSSSSFMPSAGMRPLLPLDFCSRLFNATAKQLVAIVPYTEAEPAASPMQLYSGTGDPRTVHADAQAEFIYVSPYAAYGSRSVSDSLFVSEDKYVQFKAVQDMNIRKAANLPSERENECSWMDHMRLLQKLDLVSCTQSPCSSPCMPGCYTMFDWCRDDLDTSGGRRCDYSPEGSYGDGLAYHLCESVGGSRSRFYMEGWPNSSCPFICEEVDAFPVGRMCAAARDGFYAEACNNSLGQCNIPTGVSETLFKTVANFTTTGRGDPLGCEITLAFPMAIPAIKSSALTQLLPPFTVELFVNMSADAIPAVDVSTNLAVLVGSFPEWYVALRRSSPSEVRLVLYHSSMTLAVKGSKHDNIIVSEAIPWRTGWRHVAVVATDNLASRHNVHFLVDGEQVSSGYRRVLTNDPTVSMPHVHPDHYGVFHIGPPNLKRFPEVTTSVRPYFDLPFFTAQVDEVRVNGAALDGLTLGSQITERRRLGACNVPFEHMEGSACQAIAKLTPANTSTDQASCRPGYEECGAMPGICMAVCADGMVRQPDCSCDCPPGHFQAWDAGAIHLTGSGEIMNATVYDAEHRVVGFFHGGLLPVRIDLTSPSAAVAVVGVRGGASATVVSLEVEMPAPERKRLVVKALHDVALRADRDVLLHHHRALEFNDPSLICARCPGEAPRSILPRWDAMSCRCADGYGPDLLGKCVPLRGPLQAPIINLADGSFYTAGTKVTLSMPVLPAIEGPWLLELRYEQGASPPAPNCETSFKYEEPSDGTSPGLDIIRRQESVQVRAILCHPTHVSSLETRVELHGNDHMNPPRCDVVEGNLSTQTTYALQLQVALIVDQQADATIHYRIDGSSTQTTYTKLISLQTPGTVELSVWAEKIGFDTSATTKCSYAIDGPARMSVALTWPELRPGELAQLRGYVLDADAWLARRDLDVLHFSLEVSGSPQSPSARLQYRLTRGDQQAGAWMEVPPERALALEVEEQLEAPDTTTLLRVEWRAKEQGHVWTAPRRLQVILLKTRTEAPVTEAERSVEWGLGDSWFEGPQRDAAMRQVHRILLRQPDFATRVLFSVRASVAEGDPQLGPLLDASHSNVTSLRSGGLVENFKARAPPAGLPPEDAPTACGGFVAVSGTEVPQLCDYLGPFEVLGGAVVTAFAIDAGELESHPVTFHVPKEVEPPAGDLEFHAAADAVGSVLTVSSAHRLKVLPSGAEFLSFELGQAGAERQSCVLATPFSYTSGATTHEKTIRDCNWLPYSGPPRIPVDDLAKEAGLGVDDASSLNITVLSTVKRPGYLWSFPHATSYLRLRERTPQPKVVQVLQPGPRAEPATMVWMQSQGSGVQHTPQCFFTLHYEPLEASELPDHFLVEVPALTASVGSVENSFRPTVFRGEVQDASAWKSDIELCAWPSLCELPMNGTYPAELIRAPASLQRLCAWAVWHGYLESPPTCKLLGPAGQIQKVVPRFAADGGSLRLADGQVALPLEELGYDKTLGAHLLRLRKASTTEDAPIVRRLATVGVPLPIEMTHPLEYRYAAVPLDPFELVPAAASKALLVSLAADFFSDWQEPVAELTPFVPLPARRKSVEHVLLVAEVRLFTGVGWSVASQTLGLLLLGEQPQVRVEYQDRTMVLDSLRANSTLLYKWLEGELTESEDLFESGHMSQVLHGPADLKTAFALSASLQLRDANSHVDCTALKAQEFCTLEQAEPLVLQIPSNGAWTLWAAARSNGLPLSAATVVSVAARCAAPSGIDFALMLDGQTASCAEGDFIESGASCSPVCQPGYAPLPVMALSCQKGSLTPPTFACKELGCKAPDDVLLASAVSCEEGSNLAPGSSCTPSCQAGYVPSLQSLACSQGQLNPASFTCLEAPCTAPDVVHAASPSCSGLASIQSGEACMPQCQSGFAASEKKLECKRGSLSPETFACEPGIDVGLLAASIPGSIIAGTLAALAVFCFRHRHDPKTVKVVEEEVKGNAVPDPLQEWWQCVHEVEPGICKFCGKMPEELETVWEDHGPPTLFRSCSMCAQLLGFQVNAGDEVSEAGSGTQSTSSQSTSAQHDPRGASPTHSKQSHEQEDSGSSRSTPHRPNKVQPTFESYGVQGDREQTERPEAQRGGPFVKSRMDNSKVEHYSIATLSEDEAVLGRQEKERLLEKLHEVKAARQMEEAEQSESSVGGNLRGKVLPRAPNGKTTGRGTFCMSTETLEQDSDSSHPRSDAKQHRTRSAGGTRPRRQPESSSTGPTLLRSNSVTKRRSPMDSHNNEEVREKEKSGNMKSHRAATHHKGREARRNGTLQDSGKGSTGGCESPSESGSSSPAPEQGDRSFRGQGRYRSDADEWQAEARSANPRRLGRSTL